MIDSTIQHVILFVLGTTHHGGYVHDSIVYALKECGYRHIDTAKRYGKNMYDIRINRKTEIVTHGFMQFEC